MVTTSGFSHTPITRAVILALLASTLLSSILEIKHLLPIQPIPHLWPYLQLSRILTFQLAYTTSTELLFAVALLYQFRILERLWGGRKYGSFVLMAWALVGGMTVMVAVTLKVLTFGWWSYIPSGLTGVVYAILSVWKDEVPGLYGVKILTGSKPVNDRALGQTEGERGQESRSTTADTGGLILSDKFTAYILAAQLGLSQFPYQILPAGVGWIIGAAWREGLLPMGLTSWRIPGRLVGEDNSTKSRGQYEGLRRRLEEEEGGTRDGMREVSDGVGEAEILRDETSRGFGRTVTGYFTGS